MTALKTAVSQVRLEPELQARFRARAKATDTTESKLLRDLVIEHLARPTTAPKATQSVPPIALPRRREDAETERVTLRMPAFLRAGVNARAAAAGMRRSRWLTALVQSHLLREPVMTAPELFGLREASRELAAIGRNLNQIAKAANEAALTSGQRQAVDLSGVIEVSAAVEQARKAIRALVRASQQAWAAEDEE